MMKRKYRVLKNNEFNTIINEGALLRTETASIYYLPNELKHLRVGIALSSKLANAVGRNKTKRQVRAIIRNNISFKMPLDVILVVKKSFLVKSFEENEQILKTAMSKLGDKYE
ncbi:MAG TPA: ribonuclease P protein component [Bacilli bacterium]|nr:ribonuclease P protein component [Bacilli bacterium]HPK86280.1 ribonuclease P protein component [Bacilli bacterium]